MHVSDLYYSCGTTDCLRLCGQPHAAIARSRESSESQLHQSSPLLDDKVARQSGLTRQLLRGCTCSSTMASYNG